MQRFLFVRSDVLSQQVLAAGRGSKISRFPTVKNALSTLNQTQNFNSLQSFNMVEINPIPVHNLVQHPTYQQITYEHTFNFPAYEQVQNGYRMWNTAIDDLRVAVQRAQIYNQQVLNQKNKKINKLNEQKKITDIKDKPLVRFLKISIIFPKGFVYKYSTGNNNQRLFTQENQRLTYYLNVYSLYPVVDKQSWTIETKGNKQGLTVQAPIIFNPTYGATYQKLGGIQVSHFAGIMIAEQVRFNLTTLSLPILVNAKVDFAQYYLWFYNTYKGIYQNWDGLSATETRSTTISIYNKQLTIHVQVPKMPDLWLLQQQK